MEEKVRTAETENGNATKSESRADMAKNSPTKRGRGRPQGSKKLKVCVTELNLMELVSGISNGGSNTKHAGRRESGDDSAGKSKKEGCHDDTPMTGSNLDKANTEDLPNDSPKRGRGRPKGSKKHQNECAAIPRKRGRPKGSLNKKHVPSDNGQPAKRRREGEPKLEESSISRLNVRNRLKLKKRTRPGLKGSIEGEGEAGGSLKTLKRGRGRPRKVGIGGSFRRGRGRPRRIIEQDSEDKKEPFTDGSEPVKRARGRPLGSFNSTHILSEDDLAPKRKRGRPRKKDPSQTKRGRPRKYPRPSPEELNKPKVWKPLGRPRKYPRVESVDGPPPAPPRKRGRPRKSESKKGAHLRKSLPTTPRSPSDGPPQKRGRPPGQKKTPVDREGEVPRKRGRPKGSRNKSKITAETLLDSTLPNHVKNKSSGSPLVYCEPMKEEPETHLTVEQKKHRNNTEEMNDRGGSEEVSNHA